MKRRKNGTSSNNTCSQAKASHPTNYSDYLKGGTNVNNISTTFSNSTTIILKKNHDNNGGISVSDHNAEHGTIPLVPQSNETTIMGEGSNPQAKENLNAEHGNNTNMKGLYAKVSSNDIQTASFSFDIEGSSKQLTPNLAAGNTKGTTSKNDNGGKLTMIT